MEREAQKLSQYKHTTRNVHKEGCAKQTELTLVIVVGFYVFFYSPPFIFAAGIYPSY